jgi:PII-like signaling protein
MDDRNIIHRYAIHRCIRGIYGNMSKDEFKDRLFDILNESNDLPIKDIAVDDKEDTIKVYLTDGTNFIIFVDNLYEKTLRDG